MKRRILTITVLLLFGAMVNVAVAWAIATTVRVGVADRKQGLSKHGEVQWVGASWRRFGSYKFVSWLGRDSTSRDWKEGAVFEAVIPPWARGRIRSVEYFENTAEAAQCADVIEARGWPFLSLFGWEQWSVSPAYSKQRLAGINLGFWPWPVADIDDETRDRSLPTRPIWPGFAINTLFYAAILWGLFAAPFALRRRRRIKRGLCPKCAYPVGASDVCTECGTALPKHKAETQKAETT